MDQEHFSADPYQDQEWLHAQKKKLVRDRIQTLKFLMALSVSVVALILTIRVMFMTSMIQDISFWLFPMLLFSILTIVGCILLIMSIKQHIITALHLFKKNRDAPTPKE